MGAERLTTRFCERLNGLRRLLRCRGVEEFALERRDLRLWHKYSWPVRTARTRTLEDGERPRQPRRKAFHRITGAEAGIDTPHPEQMAQAAPAFDVSPAEKRTLALITDHPMIPREHLATNGSVFPRDGSAR